MARVPAIVDVDTGIDDALALLYACASPEIDLVAVTCVNGNVPLGIVLENTLAVLALAGRPDVEVAAGADAPLAGPAVHAFEVHGSRGLGDAVVEPPASAPSPRRAVELIVEEARRRPGEVLLVTTGPLTNLALALREEPLLPRLLRGWVLMGGAFRGTGNTLPRSEANVLYDPEAAQEALAAWGGVDEPPLAIGLDVTERVVLTPAGVDEICSPAPDSPLARVIRDAVGFYIGFERRARPDVDGCFLHDPLAVAAAIDPSLVSWRAAHVEVELTGTHTRGETVADFLRMWRHPLNAPAGLGEAPDNCRCALEVDVDGFLARFVERLRGLVEARA
jgi:purine nucleosidase